MAVNPSQGESFLVRINELLDQNLEDENYGVAELVTSLGMSRTQLHRKLKSVTGKSTSRYIREFRLIKAHTMLVNDEATASEIAYRVGFASPSYFSTAFRKFYGYSPGETKFHKDSVLPLQKKSKMPLWITIGILIVALIGYWGYHRFKIKASDEKTLAEKAEYKEKTIAVLAFEDLSEDQSQKYIGMGLAVEVINILDDVEGLKVIGKTSAFSFLDKQITIDSIAALLHVNYILEGTISDTNGKKEITAILIDGVTGQTLFSESYEWISDEAFNIRSKIAKQVAYELKMKVTEDVILSSGRNNSELLALEQRAYYRSSKRALSKELIDIWDECLSIDSTYIPCIANRSLYSRSPEEHLLYVNRLMELDSTNVYTYFVKGNYFFNVDLDFQNAYLNYKKMLEKNPSDTRILSLAAFRLGHFDIDKGLKFLREVKNRDPLYDMNYYRLAHLNMLKGEFKKSVDLLYELKTITGMGTPWPVIFINIYGGYLDEAEIALSEYLSFPEPGISKKSQENVKDATALFLAGARQENLEFEKMLKRCADNGLWPFAIASSLALYGDFDRSFEWLERGYETKNTAYFHELKYAPWFQNMRNDPRWLVLMKKLNMPGYENDKIKT